MSTIYYEPNAYYILIERMIRLRNYIGFILLAPSLLQELSRILNLSSVNRNADCQRIYYLMLK